MLQGLSGGNRSIGGMAFDGVLSAFTIHAGSKLGELEAELFRHAAPLSADGFNQLLRNGCDDRGGGQFKL